MNVVLTLLLHDIKVIIKELWYQYVSFLEKLQNYRSNLRDKKPTNTLPVSLLLTTHAKKVVNYIDV